MMTGEEDAHLVLLLLGLLQQVPPELAGRGQHGAVGRDDAVTAEQAQVDQLAADEEVADGGHLLPVDVHPDVYFGTF